MPASPCHDARHGGPAPISALQREGPDNFKSHYMEKEVLKKLGIKSISDISAWELLDEKVSPLTFNVSKSSVDKILILRDIMAEYRKSRRILDKSQIICSKDAVRIMDSRLEGLDHEEFWVLFLDRSQHVLNMEQLFTGGLASVVIDPVIIAKKCILYSSTRIIMLHNHPSGDPNPGQLDIRETKTTRDALKVVGIELLDHIIIGHDTYYSFADESEGRM